MKYDLPLFEVYRRLREEAGFRLDINDYKNLMTALRCGYGIESLDSLSFLCLTLWVKSLDSQPIFEAIFEEEFSSLTSNKPSSDSRTLRKTIFPSWPTKKKNKQSSYFSVRTFAFVFFFFSMFWFLPSSKKWLESFVLGGNEFTERSDLSSLATGPDSFSATREDYGFLQGDSNGSEEGTKAPGQSESSEEDEAKDESAQEQLARDNARTHEETFELAEIILIIRERRLVLQLFFSSVILTAICIVFYFLKDRVEELKKDESGNHDNYLNSTDRDDEDYSIQDGFRKNVLSNRSLTMLQARQMRQIWRQIRYLQRAPSGGDIDLEATVLKVGERGFFSEPEYSYGRGNRAEIVFLIDRDGSMTTFHETCDQLVSTASSGSYIEDVEAFYFKNWPTKFLYKDLFCQDYVLPETALSSRKSRYSFLIVISDAGALRKGVNELRLRKTLEFMRIIRKSTKHYAWLNPVPYSRWKHSTAAEIAKSIPMFPIDQVGLRSAVRELCSH